MSPEQIMAACAIAGMCGGVFLWVVKMIVEKIIRDTINGFKTEMALMKGTCERLGTEQKELYDYTHGAMHQRFDSLSSTLLETFKAGREAGRMEHGRHQ